VTFTFEDFLKTSLENTTSIKIWQEQKLLYMETSVYLWCLAVLFLE
jgi:hypothetical protein